ncbi:MAG: carboxylating nicotinate-nucleotide diphosphorylase [Deltaproteobacteria bacterium]|nr:carboxylating nicotinate-nucleotide diphosphorylase [Deltaproteobacteria bacterium]
MADRIQNLIDIALQEDIGTGDITTNALFGNETLHKSGVILAKEDLVIAGLEIAKKVFATVDAQLTWERYFEDGAFVPGGSKVAVISGSLQSLLKAERTALNFLQHLSGIATFTREFVEKVKNYPVKILDTRKTTPGMRALEKHAVKAGGGKNHRLGLYDRFLIKDNHLAGRSITESIRLAQQNNPNKVLIEIEIESISTEGALRGRLHRAWPVEGATRAPMIDQIEEAITAGANILLLDNLFPKELRKAVAQIAGRVKTEASGGIHLDNVLDYAKTGVDFISIGALTHSAPAVDLSLEIY